MRSGQNNKSTKRTLLSEYVTEGEKTKLEKAFSDLGLRLRVSLITAGGLD